MSEQQQGGVPPVSSPPSTRECTRTTPQRNDLKSSRGEDTRNNIIDDNQLITGNLKVKIIQTFDLMTKKNKQPFCFINIGIRNHITNFTEVKYKSPKLKKSPNDDANVETVLENVYYKDHLVLFFFHYKKILKYEEAIGECIISLEDFQFGVNSSKTFVITKSNPSRSPKVLVHLISPGLLPNEKNQMPLTPQRPELQPNQNETKQQFTVNSPSRVPQSPQFVQPKPQSQPPQPQYNHPQQSQIPPPQYYHQYQQPPQQYQQPPQGYNAAPPSIANLPPPQYPNVNIQPNNNYINNNNINTTTPNINIPNNNINNNNNNNPNFNQNMSISPNFNYYPQMNNNNMVIRPNTNSPTHTNNMSPINNHQHFSNHPNNNNVNVNNMNPNLNQVVNNNNQYLHPTFNHPNKPPMGTSPPRPVSPGPTFDLSMAANLQGFNIDYQEIVFHQKIGAGAFGEVWKGEWAGTSVAIKKIAAETITEKDLNEFSTEILLMSKLRHPNIVQFLGACLHPEFFCLLTEYMEKGSLFHVLQKDPNIPFYLRMQIARDIAKGMVYLHTRSPPVIHRDIKSLNILIAKDWKATITDFGLTKIKNKAMLTTRVGSPAWSAPEILRGEPYDEKVDVYSFGIVLWEVVSGKPPYKGMEPLQLIQALVIQKPPIRPPIPYCDYPQVIELMQQCWAEIPNSRPTFRAILDSLNTIPV